MAKQKKDTFNDFGLGEKSSSEGYRALNKDGSFNIEKINIPFFERLNFFLSLVTMKWSHFFLQTQYFGFVLSLFAHFMV